MKHKFKEVNHNKCSVCGKLFQHDEKILYQVKERCVFSQCADCFLGKNKKIK